MICLLSLLLTVLMANTTQAFEKFEKQKVMLGDTRCVCSFYLEADAGKCRGKAKCDKKCSGAGPVQIGRFSFNLKVKKGKAAISKCAAEEAATGSGIGIGPISTGSGSGPKPVPIISTGSGSGETPIPINSTGSGENPVPIISTGSGSGGKPVPKPEVSGPESFEKETVMLGGKKCTCSFYLEADGTKCRGKAKCDKKCSGTGKVQIDRFTFALKVKKGKAAIAKCKAKAIPTLTGPGPITPVGSGSGPEPIEPTGSGSGPQPIPPTVSGPEKFEKEKVLLGDKKCTCSFYLEAEGAKCRGKAKCDKKCAGSGTVEMGRFTFLLKVKKGKASIAKCKAETVPTLTGSGPITILPPPGPTCNRDDSILEALCYTLSSGCNGSCTGSPSILDCSCFCSTGPSCAQFRCDAGGWLCTEECPNI